MLALETKHWFIARMSKLLASYVEGIYDLWWHYYLLHFADSCFYIKVRILALFLESVLLET